MNGNSMQNEKGLINLRIVDMLIDIAPNEAYAYNLSPFNSHCVLGLTYHTLLEKDIILGSQAMKRYVWTIDNRGVLEDANKGKIYFAEKRPSYVIG